MSQDRRYARGCEDAQEFIARALDRTADRVSSSADVLKTLAALVRSFSPETIRGAMEADDSWMRKVAEREAERVRAGWRERSTAYYDRKRRRTAGEDVPVLRRGRKKKEVK